ncbi:hypothetical protein BGZ61DRAFT_534096 [Ilyonectria robusta]|uniref:uncharacterized protein n=1 Tax=Ilyonectria robusta TaxID=1079257 RepID=UPI001E8CB038|nr:uncharacterized protein BGZ61DRAFT_534096 [Ilyonectria robusta]KAH8686577.1 hypothetical protein BGZ61DRAFT_534096 [Ilyonectria robusta]
MRSVKTKSMPFIEALAFATANDDVRKALVAQARSQYTGVSRKKGGNKSNKKKSERKKPVETGADANNVNDSAPQKPISNEDAFYDIPSPQPIQSVNGLYENGFFTPSLDEKSSVEQPSFRQKPHELPLYEPSLLSSVDLSLIKPSLVQITPDCTEKSSIKGSPKPPPKIPLPEKPYQTSKPESEPQPLSENGVWESRYHYLNDKLEPQPSSDKEVWDNLYQTLRQQPEAQPLLAEEVSERRYHYLNEELQPRPASEKEVWEDPHHYLNEQLEPKPSSEKEVWENPHHTPNQEPETTMYRGARCSTESDGAMSFWPHICSRLSLNRSTIPPMSPLSLPPSAFSERSEHSQIHASPSWGLRLKNHLKPPRSHVPPSSNAGDRQALHSESTVIPALHFDDDYRHLSRSECSFDPATDPLFAHIPRMPGQHFPGEIVVHSAANGFRPRIEVFPSAEPPTPQLKPISIVKQNPPLSLQSAGRTPHECSKANVSAWRGEALGEERLSRRTVSTEWPGLNRVAETDESDDEEEEEGEEDEEDEDGIEVATVGPEDSASCAGRKNRERRLREVAGMPPVPPRTRDWVLDNDYPVMF